MKIHCDNCDRILGTYLYGIGGVEERAVITKRECIKNTYNRCGELNGFKRLERILPDVVCFECCKSRSKLNINAKRDN